MPKMQNRLATFWRVRTNVPGFFGFRSYIAQIRKVASRFDNFGCDSTSVVKKTMKMTGLELTTIGFLGIAFTTKPHYCL